MKIVVIGAYGYTGQLICHLLNENNIPFSIAGKNQSKLEDLTQKLAGIQDVIQIDLRAENSGFVNDFDVFINCAGPFTEESSAFVNLIASIEHKFYLDISGEVGFVKASFDENHQTAVANNTLIIHGCAFESLLTDLATQFVGRKLGKLRNIYSFYAFGHSKPSPGTRITMKLSKFRKLEKVSNGNWSVINHAKDKVPVTLRDGTQKVAVPYPLPEVAFNKWNSNTHASLSYLLLDPQESMFAGFETVIDGDIEVELEKLKQRKKPGPTAEQRNHQTFELIVQAENEEGNKMAVLLSGADMYKLTAQAILLAVKQILSRDVILSGVVSPGKLFIEEESRILDELEISHELTEAFDI
jgi:short subunit dehydrogenase-like uncharacterized protein